MFRPGSIRPAWCLLTRPGSRPTFRGWGARGKRLKGYEWPLADNDASRAICVQADVVFDGNLARQEALAADARLAFLPPYSPDLNPIEQLFAKIKHWMRMASERTIAAWKRIGTITSTVTAEECSNYFKNAGYASA